MATAAPAKITLPNVTRTDFNGGWMTAVFGISDFISVLVAVLLGFRLWAIINPKIPALQSATLLTPVLAIATFYSFGLYPGIGLNAVTQIKRASHALTLVFLLCVAAMFMSKEFWADSRGGFLLAWLLSLTITPLGRVLSARLLTSQSNWGVPAIIIGDGAAAQSVVTILREHKILGYQPVACISQDPCREEECEGVPIAGCLDNIESVARTLGVKHAIVAMPSLPHDRLIWHMRSWSRIFPRILIVPNLAGIASLWTEPRDLGGVLALEIQHKLLDGWNEHIKRAVDVAGSVAALVLAAPFLAGAAVFVKWKSPGPIFYTQQREGKDGRTIRVLKLRSMHPHAEQMLQEHLAANPEACQEWNRFHKLKNDPRIIPGVGNFIRRSSIDELPQLWNVMKGEMSLVGPRPFPAYHNSKFDPDFRDFRLQVTPGLTGMWQVSARSAGDLRVQELMDAYYIRNWSIWLDLYILLQTVRAVLMPSGSY